MCGICGFIKYDKGVNDEDHFILKKMNEKLYHRGPDAQNEKLFENVAFGFSRLSIIGLENGMQPIYNEDESVVIICNGEIFNYLELRQDLIAKGHQFRTSSDIEVILHLYEDHGMDFLNDLNGQFAFVIFDRRKKQLFCARDQMGIIPFFYTKVEDTFIFGSEIKAILEHPLVHRKVDKVGLDQIFTFAGLVSPRTMFENIQSLPNGHYLNVSEQGDVAIKEYWDLVYPEGTIQTSERKPEEYYTNKLEELIDNSIKLRLRADVPSGFYLSGGLDSSLIAMKVNQHLPDKRNEAFSIDFAESELSETPHQQLMAKASNSNLNKRTFYYKDISERLQQSIYHSECPIKETYNTASLALSKSVSDKGIKVILSGEGADELFAGYVGYRFDKMRELNLVETVQNSEEEHIRRKIWGDESFFYEHNYGELEKVKKTLYSSHINAGYEETNCLNHFVVNKDRLAGRDSISKRSYLDFKLRLTDHLVSDHGDRMALANSVEVRYPFLDKNIVEFSSQIPSDLKLNDFQEKYILKKVAENRVPKSIIEREKFGFVAPGSPYLLQNNIEYINDILSYDLIKRQNFFNPDEIERLKKIYQQPGFTLNIPFENDLLITVITFGIFQDQFFR